jgi:hypothetical protein
MEETIMGTIMTPANIDDTVDAVLLLHDASPVNTAAATADEMSAQAELRARAIQQLHAWQAELPEAAETFGIAADCSAPVR